MMNTEVKMSQEKAAERLAQIREDYSKKREFPTYSCLLAGREGSGKTSSLITAPRPVLIDSFDPNGTLVLDRLIQDQGLKGIYIRPFWHDSHKKPHAYMDWERQWDKDTREGFLGNIGTYCIDSGTTFLDSMTYYFSQKKGRPEGTLALNDYIPLYNTLTDIIRISQTQGCNFIFTGHLELDKDEETGRVIATLATYNKLKVKVPLLFTEKLVMIAKSASGGTQHYFLTQPEGMYQASTQLGAGGRFEKHEEPNFKKLLTKAGLDAKDKPF